MRRLFLAATLLLSGCGDGETSVPATSIEAEAGETAVPSPPLVTEVDQGVAPTEPVTSTTPAAAPAEGEPAETTTTVGTDDVQALVPEVISTIGREPDAFTQGLELVGDRIVESSGLYGESFVRLVDPATWDELAVVDLPESVFGEGATVVGDRVIVLTWQAQTALVYALEDLSLLGELGYPTEGWGLCELDDGRLAMSDGSATITFRDPGDLSSLGEITAILDGKPIGLLNELECVGDDIWANVWQTEEILRIDVATGRVEAVVDADGLLEPDPASADSDAVLNGIAHLGDDRFLITGKRWPAVFEVRFVPAPG